jgi:glycyl-tRNA synthetase
MADTTLMEKLSALCKRRGFIFPSSEIYGGIGGFWDYGPLGVELKNNIKQRWWRDMITNPPNGPDGGEVEMQGLDCTIIMNPKVWEASGHVGGFSDPMVDCKACKARFRADQLSALELIFHESQEELHVLITGSGSREELLEVNSKRISKLVKAHGKWTTLSTLLDYETLNEEGRAKFACPECGETGNLTEPRQFNLMFESNAGALRDESSKVYLRPETAQGIFANFKNVLDTSRVKLPFGIGQIGKSFRNEINPRNFTFRSREFEQMEIEFFCKDEDSLGWYEFWRNTRFQWYVDLGLKSEKLRLRDQEGDELAHYSKACADIEYLFPFSDEPQELEGVAHRGCYDLTKHSEHSGKDLSYFDDELWQADAHQYKDDKKAAKEAKSKAPYRFIPTVIEPSAGADRATLAFLCEAYTEDQAPDDKGAMQTRVVMKLHPKLAPIKAAFLPLVNRDGMPETAHALYREAKKRFNVFFDDGGAIGRRYRRQDEAGTPFCITVDGDTATDGSVTIRDRDSLEQVRVNKDQVVAWLAERVQG